MTGTIVAQAIPIAIAPILTRLYAPEDFGVFALFMSIVSVIGVVATARYELAVILPKEDEDAINIIALSLIISFIISLLTLLIVFFFNEPISKLLNNKGISRWLYFMPLAIFLTGIYQVFNYWSSRKKKFVQNAVSRVSVSSSIAIGNLGMGYSLMGSAGLIFSGILSQFVGVLILGWEFVINLGSYKKQISKKKVIENMIKYRNFAKINSPHALVDSLQDNGIIFLITYYFTSTIVGFYSFAFRILKAPVGLIGSSFYQVFYQKASIAINENQNLRILVVKILKKLFLFGLPFFLILFITAPWVFSIVFGEKWRVAGEIAQIMTPWIFFNFIISPLSCLPILLNKQKEAMLITFADVSIRVLSLIIGGVYRNYKLSLIIISVSCSLLLIFALFWYYNISSHNFNKSSDKKYYE